MREGDPSQSTVLATDFYQSAMLLINPLSLHSSCRLPFSFIYLSVGLDRVLSLSRGCPSLPKGCSSFLPRPYMRGSLNWA
ncbi:hypothetical protein Lalb_Chr00c21g0405921 (mitochondrion) [Lupinus albus]|uniref:Uncharacterized protein n=1 Tax=Lupinus albus TaxID=3870 RepID=A0A6A4MJ26_LUPAL|nr:hypothetical protein Lalb_Chr00c21g0405921 [Lupinus albus]